MRSHIDFNSDWLFEGERVVRLPHNAAAEPDGGDVAVGDGAVGGPAADAQHFAGLFDGHGCGLVTVRHGVAPRGWGVLHVGSCRREVRFVTRAVTARLRVRLLHSQRRSC
jgi:hypothetical protein